MPQASEIAVKIEMLVEPNVSFSEESYHLLGELIQELQLLVLHTDTQKINYQKSTLDINPITENNNRLKATKIRLLIVGDDKEL